MAVALHTVMHWLLRCCGFAAVHTGAHTARLACCALRCDCARVITGRWRLQVYRQVAFFPALFQMTELTVLPTNVLWFATKFQVQAPRLKRAAILLRALFYVVFRLFVGPLALAHAVRCHGGAGFLTKFLAAPWPVWVGNTFNVGSLSYLNVVWTLAAVRRALGKARRA